MKRVIALLIILSIFLTACGNKAELKGGSVSLTISPNKNSVNIQDFAFNPDTLTIKEGESVTWTNQDSAQHNIKIGDFISKTIGKGESIDYKFDQKGSYDYICGIHPSMKGKIIVE